MIGDLEDRVLGLIDLDVLGLGLTDLEDIENLDPEVQDIRDTVHILEGEGIVTLDQRLVRRIGE